MTAAVLGHRGMVGSAICRALRARDVNPLIPNVDLCDCGSLAGVIASWQMTHISPDVLFLCAAKVGGIRRNINEPVTMLRDNLLIAANTLEWVRRCDIKLFVYFGSSCIYPKDAPNPIKEEALLTGPLEPTNEPYAVAKIAGVKLCQAYEKQYGLQSLIVMPCNLYGPGDNYDLENGHMVAAMIRKFYEASRGITDGVTLWGTGTPRRECMHVDDLAAAVMHLIDRNARGMINAGTGTDDSIYEIAQMMQRISGVNQVTWDHSRPNGVAKKVMDVSRLRSYGWAGARPLADGLAQVYNEYAAMQGKKQ